MPKKEALIVVVPFHSEFFSFPYCQVPFFNDLQTVNEFNGWISFEQNIPSITLKNLYIRESYRTIASNINTVVNQAKVSSAAKEPNASPRVEKAIITGTPGIGKSLFLIYFLWKLVKEGKRVLFIFHPFSIYYDGSGGVFRFASGHLPLDNDDSFWNETLWCLFDAKGKKEADLSKFPYGLCNFILSTSPKRELINDFKKPPIPQMFYMPTWSKAEMEAIVPFFPNATEWRDRFAILGGVPRHVLEVTEQSPTKMLMDACQRVHHDNWRGL